MNADVNLFVGIAELAGVFVAFGALIGVIRSGDIAPPQLGLIRVLVTLSLVVIIAALLPFVVASFEYGAHTTWAVSSLTFLVLLWMAIGLAVTNPDYRHTMVGQVRHNRTRAATFWVLRVALWVLIQLPLVLILFGVNPALDMAFYLTALTFNLFEAAFILAQIVYAQVADNDA